MKITIYELLGLIKDGKAPRKIKGRLDMIYTFDASENDYVDDEAGKLLFYNLMHFRDKCLNDEVEIIDYGIDKLNKDKYVYFISWNFKKGFDTGFASGTFSSDAKLDSAEAYSEFTNFIKKENELDNVVILFFKELKEEI